MQTDLHCGKIKTNRRRFRCPNCQKHTLLFLEPDTEVKNLPLKCKLCGKEIVVNISPEPVP